MEETNQPTELMIVPPLEALGVYREPDIVLQEAHKAADALMDVIRSKTRKPVKFGDELYLEYEDWLTLARFYSMTPVLVKTEPVELFGGKVTGFKATVEVLLIPTNQIIGRAEALCLDDERNWSNKPTFQRMSMAQTRAGSKALASVLRWVVVLAGYKGTPAEEMNGYAEKPEKDMFDDCKTLNELMDEYAVAQANAKAKGDRELWHKVVWAKNKQKAKLEKIKAGEECPF